MLGSIRPAELAGLDVFVGEWVVDVSPAGHAPGPPTGRRVFDLPQKPVI